MSSLTQCQKLKGLALQTQRYGSVCTGALLLAQTGLLAGKKVTTHWSSAILLAARYPDIDVIPDALYLADGALRTAAGVTSGLDLALRLVEEDLGREVARDIAANLVMFFKRTVNQSHFSREQQASLNGRRALQALQRWVLDNLSQVKSVQQMAGHLNLSVRHLTRLFHQELQCTLGEGLEVEKSPSRVNYWRRSGYPSKRFLGVVIVLVRGTFRRAFVDVWA